MNGANVGSIEYTARIDTTQLKRDAAETERIAKQTGNSVGDHMEKGNEKAGNSVMGLGKKIVGLVAAYYAATGAAQLLAGSFKDLAGLETARSSFVVLTGSAEKAATVMKDIATYANNTPFEFPQIASAARTLLGFGVTAEDVQASIVKLGDAAAASGGDLQGVSVVFGQIFAAGKMNAQDFLQLINNGIALGPEISKRLGIPMKDLKDKIEDGAVTFDVFNDALKEATSKGGKYFQATDKLALTLNGRIATLKDTFTGFVGFIVGVDFTTGVVNAGGMFERLSNAIAGTTSFLAKDGRAGFESATRAIIGLYESVAKYLGPKLSELGRTLNDDLMPILRDLWNNVIVPLAPVIGTLLVGAIGLAVDITTELVEALGWLYEAFKDGNPVIIGLATTFGVLAAAMAFNAIFNALSVGFATLTLITIPSAMASVTALAALITAPIVFPAIVIGAAIAALLAIKNAAEETRRAIDSADQAVASLHNSDQATLQMAQKKRKSGEWTEAQYQRIVKSVSNRASGGPVSANTPYWVGENSDGSLNATSELFVPRSAGTVVSSSDLGKFFGDGTTTGKNQTINQTNNIYNQIDMRVASHELAYMVARG